MQFTKPDARQLQALARLVRTPDGEVLVKLMSTELQKVMELLMEAGGETTPKLQGQAKSTSGWIKLLNASPELAEKAR